MKKLIFIIFVSLITPAIFAQTDTTGQRIKRNKNCVYGTLGTAFVYSNFTGNIERQIKSNPDKFFKYTSIRLGGGTWSSWGNEGFNIFSTINWLSGTNSGHFEMGFGLAFSPTYDDSYYFLPAAHVGYRFQKPDGLLIFRAGVGVPEALYLSLGACF